MKRSRDERAETVLPQVVERHRAEKPEILDRPDAPNGKGIYYIVVQRMRFDHLPGGLLNIRGRVIGRTHDALRDELKAKKASLEAH